MAVRSAVGSGGSQPAEWDKHRSPTGFKPSIAGPGQGNDVYKHVNFVAGAQLTTATLLTYVMKAFDGIEVLEGRESARMELAGDYAGENVGNAMVYGMWTQNLREVKSTITKTICK